MSNHQNTAKSKVIICTATMLITVAVTLFFTQSGKITYLLGDILQNLHDPSFLPPEQLQAARDRNIQVRNKMIDLPSLSTNIPNDDKYKDISGDEIHQYLRELTEFSQQSKAEGEVLWGRIQGSKYEYEATQYVAEKFTQWGLKDVSIERAPVREPVWRPTAIELTIKGGDDHPDYTLKSAMTAFPSGTTPAEGLTAPIEYVGMGTRADLRGKDLKGKIALLYVRAWEGVLLHSGHLAAVRLVKQHGAESVILWLDLPGNEKYAAQLFSQDGFLTEVPWTNIGYEDGLYLRKRLEHSAADNPPKVNLKIVGSMRENLKSQNLIAQLPGNSDKTIMLTAHIDGFFNATLDNGTGVSALMTLAHYYSQIPENQRAYNLLFLITGDHEQSGAGGIHNFIEKHPDLLAKTELIVQLEHMASPSITKELNVLSKTNTEASRMLMITNLNPWLIERFTEAATRYGIVMGQSIFQEYAGDVEGMSESGIPAVGWIEAGYYYHNEADAPENISAEALQNMTRAYASIIDQIGESGIERIREDEVASPPPIYASDELFFFLSQW